MLRTTIVVDYQNMHMMGRGRFLPEKPLSECLLDPVRFAETLINFRNLKAPSPATVTKVLVFRGLPSAIYDPIWNSRNLAQKHEWEKDPRVTVFHRPLKYEFDEESPRKRTYLQKREKGIDVMCALAVIRSVNSPDCDLVILASHDTDLEPALEEAVSLGMGTRIESCSWFNIESRTSRSYLRPHSPKPIWNHRLGRIEFESSLDRRSY